MGNASTDEEALDDAMDQWSSHVVGAEVAWDLRRPADFDETGKLVTEEKMRQTLPISSDLAFHAAWIADLLTLGPAQLHLHQVGRNQRRFIEEFGARVLPQFRAEPNTGVPRSA